MTWETVIGLEVHVQLKTRTKLFCACAPVFGDPPNRHVCPVCLGLPGALPVPNAGAVRLAVRAALGLGCSVHEESVFARKHYCYPDLPKGYQISQFERPLATGGRLDLAISDAPRPIRVARLHLEEDAGKSFHDRAPGRTGVDFNRCGMPLIEIVTEPDLRSPSEARRLLAALKQLLEYLDVSDCNMEEGSLRVDANLSVRRAGDRLGTKQELKNMNSFSAVERALERLRDRQVAVREGGGRIELTTYSAATGELRPIRTKEESPDYRYAPDPDLPPLRLEAAGVELERARADLPELPAARHRRLVEAHGLLPTDADVLTARRATADYYEAVVAAGADARSAAHWVKGPVLRRANERGGALTVAPRRLADLIELVERGVLTRQAAQRVLEALADGDAPPRAIAERLGLVRESDSERLVQWIGPVLDEYPDEIARYREGETKLLGFLIGEVMRASRGRADPLEVRRLLRKRLEGGRTGD